jgi:hypothetical protein
MIVCADDYGLREDIDQAILDLTGAGKLAAVSCMAVLESCTPESLGKVLQRTPAVDVGLHLCLTSEDLPDGLPTDAMGTHRRAYTFRGLLVSALAGRVSEAGIRGQVAAQYELFMQKAGRRPDYLDGHLHVHQLPSVRDGLIEFVLSLPVAERPYVRNTAMPLPKLWKARLPWLKAWLIGSFGAELQRMLRRADIATNQGFAGIYDFEKWRRYGAYLPRFAACLAAPNGILVVHPGSHEPWRKQEYCVLKEFTFAAGSLNRLLPACQKQPPR